MPRNGFASSSWLREQERSASRSQDGDIWTYRPSNPGDKWAPLRENSALERYPSWSPDGRWLAFVSDVSGRDEVYVEPYPGPGTPVVVSASGGRGPVWNRNGRELIYIEPRANQSGSSAQPPLSRVDGRVMSVSMTSPGRPGHAEPLFDTASATMPMGACASTPCYSIAPDGQSFFTMRFRPWNPPRVTSMRIVLDWFEEVRRLAPME